MKLGLEYLNIPQEPEVIVTAEQMLQDELEYIIACNEVNSAIAELDKYSATHTSVEEIINVIKTHGISDGLVALLEEELGSIDAFTAKDVEGTTVALEGVMADTGKKIWEAIKALIEKIKIFLNTSITTYNLLIKIYDKEYNRVDSVENKVWKNENVSWYHLDKSDDELRIKTQNDMLRNVIFITKDLKNGDLENIDKKKELLTGNKETITTFINKINNTSKDYSAEKTFENIKENGSVYKANSKFFNELLTDLKSINIASNDKDISNAGKQLVSLAFSCVILIINLEISCIRESIKILKNIKEDSKKD